VSKIICFDVWGTLILTDGDRFRRDVCNAVSRIIKEYEGVEIGVEELLQVFDSVDRRVRDRRLRELIYIPPEESIALLLREVLGKEPRLILVDEVHDAICRVIETTPHVRPAEGVYELLDMLKASGYSLAIVSNVVFWHSNATRRLLRRFNLDTFFDIEIYADLVKEVKPSTRMLNIVERQLGGTVKAHIGDSFSEDAAMALAYKVKAVLIDRKSQYLKDKNIEVLLNGNLIVVKQFDNLLNRDILSLVTS